jgi:hypothetical protein
MKDMHKNPASNLLVFVLVGAIFVLLAAPARAANGAKDLFSTQLNNPSSVTNYGLRYWIELVRGGHASKVDSQYSFQTGDRIRFHVSPNIDGFMYIFMTAGSSGNQAVLFPVAGTGDNNKVVAGKEYVIPEVTMLQFDEHPGVETLQLVLSAKPLKEGDAKQARSVTIRAKGQESSLEKGSSVSPPEDGQADTAVVSADTTRPLIVEIHLKHGAPSSSRFIATPSVIPHIDKPAPPVESDSVIPDKWAVVIGVSNFKNPLLNLKYPAKDAQDFAHFLTQEAHFSADHVRLLIDGQATRDKILTDLGNGWLPHNVKAGDLVVIYIAGHGTSVEQDIAGKNFLVVYDTDPTNAFVTGIEIQDLARTLARRLSTNRIMIVLDTCHAGAAEDGAKTLAARLNPLNLENVIQGSGHLIIASAGPNQMAYDSRRYSNGIFTRHFIEGLRQCPVLENAFAFAKSAVQQESTQDFGKPQTPILKDAQWKGAHLMLSVIPAHPHPVVSGDP